MFFFDCGFVIVFYYFVLSVNVSVKRCGGVYGVRIIRVNYIGVVCVLVVYVIKRYIELLV